MRSKPNASVTFDDFCPASLRIMNRLYNAFAILALAVVHVTAESHTVSFDNRSVVVFMN